VIEPGWLVLGAGLAVVVLDLVRGWQRRRRSPVAKPAAVTVNPVPRSR
jgi:hypothetical protein